MTQNQTNRPAPDPTGNSEAGKYLTFVLAEELYGFEILKVREILGLMKITSVPRTPDYIEGVVNLRGKVIPVIDLRCKFSMAATERTEETCIIVVSVSGTEMGIIVDQVSEVKDIKPSEIEATPNLGNNVDTSFILGIGKIEDRVIILLNIDKILTSDDLQFAMSDLSSSGANKDQAGEVDPPAPCKISDAGTSSEADVA